MPAITLQSGDLRFHKMLPQAHFQARYLHVYSQFLVASRQADDPAPLLA